MENEVKKFTVPNAEGVDTEYEIIAAFADDETGKQYIIFTDNSTNADGAICVSAACFKGDINGEITIAAIETAEEWEKVNSFIRDMNKEILGE